MNIEVQAFLLACHLELDGCPAPRWLGGEIDVLTPVWDERVHQDLQELDAPASEYGLRIIGCFRCHRFLRSYGQQVVRL